MVNSCASFCLSSSFTIVTSGKSLLFIKIAIFNLYLTLKNDSPGLLGYVEEEILCLWSAGDHLSPDNF